MGLFTPRQRRDERDAETETGLVIPLDDEVVCPTCLRTLHPWQATCPEHDEAGIPRGQASAMAPPPAHLLDDLDDGLDSERER